MYPLDVPEVSFIKLIKGVVRIVGYLSTYLPACIALSLSDEFISVHDEQWTRTRRNCLCYLSSSRTVP